MGLIFYTYANNNPAKYIDPTGESPMDVLDMFEFFNDLSGIPGGIFSGYKTLQNRDYSPAARMAADSLKFSALTVIYLRTNPRYANLSPGDLICEIVAEYGADVADGIIHEIDRSVKSHAKNRFEEILSSSIKFNKSSGSLTIGGNRYTAAEDAGLSTLQKQEKKYKYYMGI